MTSLERVNAALNHKEPDKVPFDLGASSSTGICKEAYLKVLPYLGLPAEEPKICCMDMQLADVSEAFYRAVGTDPRGVAHGCSALNPTRQWQDDRYLYYEDGFNMQWAMPREGGFYYDLIQSPLKDAESVEDARRLLRIPNPNEPSLYQGLRAEAQGYLDAGHAPLANYFCCGFLEMGTWLLGYEKCYMDFYLNPELIDYVFDRLLEAKLHFWENLLREVGDLIVVARESDDLGSQSGLLISPDTYRRFIKPRQKILFDFIHKHSQAKVFFHSCGAVRDLIGDFIEVGVDILNPVQYTANGMEAKQLKQDFGKDLVFWGGGIDTQKILPTGTPAEIKDAVKRQIEILAPGGGFVFSGVHNIQPDVPPQNLMAMLEAVAEYR